MDSNRKMFAAIIVAVLVAAVIIGRILIATAPKAQRQPGERQARLVEVATMAPSDERVKIAAYGQVEASQRINLAAQVAGRVISLSPRFIPGQRVRAGEVLLQIDPADYQVALDNAQAALASAQAALSQERGSQAVARGDFEALKLEVDADERALMLREPQLRAAEANLRSAEAAVAQAKLNLERCSLRAPLDALVLSRTVGVGAQVSGANMALAELAAASPFWVMLLVPVDELRWVELPDAQGAPGSSVELRDVSQPKASPWRGQVIQLLDAVEEQGRRARLLVEVDPQSAADGGALLLGSYVQAQIIGRQLRQVYRLDPAWLDDDRVWTVRDGRLLGVRVEVLHRSESTVLARAEFADAEQVVSSLLNSAVEGMRVRTADQPVGAATEAAGAGQ
ncbi:MAG: efflux RND transporter periplasmic adaptor subunit [Xanthomonadales bacterium]|nr:efflux RND transporter periplasmic adaptor subunit [Xanthomonadales bacterium]